MYAHGIQPLALKPALYSLAYLRWYLQISICQEKTNLSSAPLKPLRLPAVQSRASKIPLFHERLISQHSAILHNMPIHTNIAGKSNAFYFARPDIFPTKMLLENAAYL